MVNKSLVKTPIPELRPEERVASFSEVALGYTLEQAKEEAARCLNCKKSPCVAGCPVGVQIPEFITKIQEGDIAGAAVILKSKNLLPAICGRVCPQETQCEALCLRGKKGESVAVGRLERFVADQTLDDPPPEKPPANGHKVAVVGSGPSGLTCAGELAGMGYAVTIFEALHKAGGVLVYGIPEFRLPKAIVARELQSLEHLGVVIRTNSIVGRTFTVDELFAQGYEAVFIGSGAGLPSFLGIPGEACNGVYSANEYLTRINLMKAYEKDSRTPVQQAKKVCVVGGGNVAMDAARCARRIGADVTIVYRRTEKELPARLEEIHHAKEEGIVFKLLTNPLRIDSGGDGWVKSLRCQEMKLGEPDASGRARPIPVEGSEFDIETECVVMAIGNSPNPLISRTTEGLEVNRHGCLILADEDAMLTTRQGVYAGGDAVTGAATVILAMGAGKTAAGSIDEYIQSKNA
ncbi:MAG: NADPH-dependent glutamate synthase [Gracilibacteraceae bacterium]|nr:NADPH-dependent glutamate synthase [Gracilibacteraceae bacterium]